jgi:hypothetical protein
MGSFQWKFVEYKEQNGFAIVNFSRRDRLQRRPYRIEQGSQETYVLARAARQECGIQTKQGEWESQVGCCGLRAEVLHLWLETYSNFEKLSKTRYCGTGAAVIQTDDQMLLAQQCIANLCEWRNQFCSKSNSESRRFLST